MSKKSLYKANFFLFTGGPGAGKTTILEALKQDAHQVVPEVARAIIKKQHDMGGNATHYGDRNVYCDLMIRQSIEDYLAHLHEDKTIFFDRGLPDLYSYTKRFCGGVRADVYEAIQQYRYYTKAFIFPAWPEIYCQDSERKQDFQEAIDTYYAVKEGYTACGYDLIEVPKASIAARVEFILNTIKRFM